MLPNFLIIGSQRAGTTSMYRVFSQHPEIFVSKRKELNFFFVDHNYRKGIEHYARYFREAEPSHLAVGEATPSYISSRTAAARIKEHLPDVRMILTVRNPVDRAHSSYLLRRQGLTEDLSFEELVDRMLAGTLRGRGYFKRGLYMTHIRRFLGLFGGDQLLVLPFDDLVDDSRGFYETCFWFLGVDPHFECAEMYEKSNSLCDWKNPLYRYLYRNPQLCPYIPMRMRARLMFGGMVPAEPPPMSGTARRKLLDYYAPHNTDLAEFLGRDLSSWNQ